MSPPSGLLMPAHKTDQQMKSSRGSVKAIVRFVTVGAEAGVQATHKCILLTPLCVPGTRAASAWDKSSKLALISRKNLEKRFAWTLTPLRCTARALRAAPAGLCCCCETCRITAVPKILDLHAGFGPESLEREICLFAIIFAHSYFV